MEELEPGLLSWLGKKSFLDFLVGDKHENKYFFST